MNDARARLFVEKYTTGETSPEDKAAFMHWLYGQPEAEIGRLLEEYQYILQDIQPVVEQDPQWALRLNERIDRMEATPVRRMLPRRWWTAAAVLLLAVAGTYWWLGHSSSQTSSPSHITTVTAQQVAPGSDKAILTLSDGTVVTLDSAGNRALRQGGTSVLQKGGELVYNTEGDASALGYNTLRTPRGGEFHLTLPDGTRIWLNAASSLRYPTAFTGKERLVEITGEAYFEVAKDASKPFRVSIGRNATIDVLGTSFNVNSYENEKQQNITLLQGSVRVYTSPKQSVILRPGQQAQLAEEIRVVNADTDKAIAWKNGAFNFDNVSIGEAMRQLERWYNIDVVYENGIPDIYFGGELSRNMGLSDLLIALEKSNVHFRIEGKRLVVTK